MRWAIWHHFPPVLHCENCQCSTVCSAAYGWTGMGMAKGQLLYSATVPPFYHPVKLPAVSSPKHFQFHLQPPYFIEKLFSSHNFPAFNLIFLGKDEQLLKKSSPPSWLRVIRLDLISSVSLLFEVPAFLLGCRSQYINVESSSLKQPTRGDSKLTISLNF